jgi:phosphatidylglycerophosphate synthase
MIILNEVKKRAKKKNNDSFKKLFFFSSRFSIYFSWVFLNIGFNANQVTAVFFLTGLLSGLFFLSFNPLYILIGVILWRLHIIFDLCDGEVARFNQSFSINGAYWDYMIHAVLFPMCFFSITYALSQHFSNPQFLIVGAIGSIVLSLMLAVKNNYYRAMLFSDERLDISKSAQQIHKVKYSLKDIILYVTSFDAMIVIYLIFCLIGASQYLFFGLLICYILFFFLLGTAKFFLFSRDGLYRRRS